MKKISLMSLCLIVAIVAILAGAVYAASVYDRSTVSLGTSTGTAQWTNTWQYSALELKRIWIQNCLAAVDTVTVRRITSDNIYTQTVGTVVCASNAGSTPTFTAAYMKVGDRLTFSSLVATGSTAMIEYEVQQ
jgi:hypothetical protein